MTPMIDVVMCLIVFYLMVGQLAIDRRSSIVLAETVSGIDHQDLEDVRGFVFDVPESWMERASAMALKARDGVKCPVTGEAVHPESPSWPFVSEQARMSDLHGWMSEKFSITRPIEQADLDQE